MCDENYAAVLERMVEDALLRWGRPNGRSRETDFPSDHMEVLTFFHGPLFELICTLQGEALEEAWTAHGIPERGEYCCCYSCRPDAQLEAKVIAKSGLAKKPEYRFSPGDEHYVYWDGDNITHILPRGDGKKMDAKSYLRYMPHVTH